jgi:hypothetical protein
VLLTCFHRELLCRHTKCCTNSGEEEKHFVSKMPLVTRGKIWSLCVPLKRRLNLEKQSNKYFSISLYSTDGTNSKFEVTTFDCGQSEYARNNKVWLSPVSAISHLTQSSMSMLITCIFSTEGPEKMSFCMGSNSSV